MEKPSEIRRLNAAIQQGDMDQVLRLISVAKRPGALQTTITLMCLAEIGLQLHQITAHLASLRRALLRGPEPTLP